MSLHKAIAPPIEVKIGNETRLRFRRIGLDVWAEFCDHVVTRRTASIHNLSVGDREKATLYQQLVGKGVDMDDMLTEASTMDGMTWLLCRCCIDKDMDDATLMQVIPLRDIAGIFGQIADMSESDVEGAGEGDGAGNQ